VRGGPDQVEARRRELRDGFADALVLGDFRDDDGRRVLEFGRSVGYLKNLDVLGWVFVGPKVVADFLQSVLDGPGNLVSHHSELARV
jgi:hypothetical protein